MLPLRLLTAVFCHSGRPESTILVVTQASVSQPYAHVRREISYPSPRKFRLARPRAPRRSGDDSQSYPADGQVGVNGPGREGDRKSTRLNSSHLGISYAVFCLKLAVLTIQLESGSATSTPPVLTTVRPHGA